MRGDEVMALLCEGDPPPVRVTNPGGRSSFLLTGDHAGNAVPRAMGSLGLGPGELARHIGWDIGIAGLGRQMAEILDATFVEQRYSRLVIDCNRQPDRPDAVPAVSDGTVVPANADPGDRDRQARIRSIHSPYHRKVAELLADRIGVTMVALHSFTPVMDGIARPWDIGILYDGGDTSFAGTLLGRLRSRGDLTVGDNQPYRMDETDYSVPRHAYAARRPYAEVEVRQDHLTDSAGQARWAHILADALRG